MKRVLAVVLAAGMLAALAPLAAQSRATATNVPTIAHEAVPDFFKNPPGIYTGENMGIATNSKGQIYIFHRANETRLFEYSPQRRLRSRDRPRQLRLRVRALGARRRRGQHLGGRRRHRHAGQVQPAGKVLMTIGRREDPVGDAANMPGGGTYHGRNAKYRFGRQTDVAFDQQGNVFVSDGYFDARVVKYDRTAASSRPSARAATASSSSTRRIRSPPTSRATSTSAIAAMRASRCSTTT